MSAEASGLRRVEVGSEASSNLNLLSPVPGEGFTPPPSPAKENFSKPLGLITSLGRGSPLSLVRRGDDQGGRGYGHIPLTVTATKTVYYDDIGVMQRSCTFWGALGAS